jgi:hypothetical protein
VLPVIGYASRSGDFASFEGLSQSGYVLVPAPGALAYELSVAQQGDVEEPDIAEVVAAAQPPADDLDADGLGDLLELALGSDPTDAGSVARPSVALVRGAEGRWQIALDFTRSPDATSLRVVAEHAATLGDWEVIPAASVTESVTVPSAGSPLERVRWSIDPSTISDGHRGLAGFLRLRVWWLEEDDPVADRQEEPTSGAGGAKEAGQPEVNEP